MSPVKKFERFPAPTMAFLKDFAKHNDKPWFAEHKQEYLDKAVAPAQVFILALGEELKKIIPDICFDTRANGTGSLGRVYRDVRFSRDKTPYNPRLRMTWWLGTGKRMQCPGFFISFDPFGKGGMYTGKWRFDPAQLAAYRQAVGADRSGKQLEKILARIGGYGRYTVGGIHFKKTPRGFTEDHPRAELLRFNGLWVAYVGANKLLTGKDCVKACAGHFEKTAPVLSWLTDHIPF